VTFGRFVGFAGIALAWSSAAFAQDAADEPVEARIPELEMVVSPRPTELAEQKAIEPALRKGLEVPDGFCTGRDYELLRDERRLCDLAQAAKERCPGFARACEEARTEEGFGRGFGSDGRRERAGRRDRRGSGDERRETRVEVSPGPLGEVLGGVMKLVFWGLLAVGIGAMLHAAVTALVGRRKERNDDAPDASETAPKEIARTLAIGSPAELLARSREIALGGDFETAMEVVLRALLRHLEIGGRLELHPSRTNGDYARSLRRKGYDAGDLRKVAAEVEAIEFGGARPSPETFSVLHARVSKLVEVAGVAVVCLSLGLVTGCSKPAPSESSVNSCGTEADGYSALCETLAARGVNVRRRFGALENIGEGVTRVVVLADDLEPQERKVLLDWVDMGGTLVVFERHSTYDERFVTALPCRNDLTLESGVWKLPPGATPRFWLSDARTLRDTAGASVTVRCAGAPFVLEVSREVGQIIAVGDYRLATNASLAAGDNASLVAALVASPGETVELIGAWTGSATDLPAESLTRSGLLPWFLQILVLGLAFALYRGSPFGSRREPVSVSRRAFAEHAIALGDAYSRARASRLTLVHFGAYAFERLRVRLSATKHGRLSDLAGALAARHAVSEAEVMTLVAAVRSAEDPAHDSGSEAEHLAALRRLSALVMKTGGTS
jgi:hypothetical protein